MNIHICELIHDPSPPVRRGQALDEPTRCDRHPEGSRSASQVRVLTSHMVALGALAGGLSTMWLVRTRLPVAQASCHLAPRSGCPSPRFWRTKLSPEGLPGRLPAAPEEAPEEGVLLLPGGLLLGGAPAALVLGHAGEHLVDVLAAPGPRRLVAPRAGHLSTHSRSIPQGVFDPSWRRGALARGAVTV